MEYLNLVEEELFDYNPLRFNRALLQKLDELLPQFKELLVELKNMRIALGNGDLDWWPKGNK